MKEQIEKLFKDLIEEYEMDFYGEKLEHDIYQYREYGYKDEDGVFYMESIEAVFNDENMAYLLAGHVASSVYDEMEKRLKALGLEITDGDGSRVTLGRTAIEPAVTA